MGRKVRYRVVFRPINPWGLAEAQRVVPFDASEGPDCGSRATFLATAGTSYDIGVDGNFFYPDPAVHLSGEGPIKLQLTATPPPAGDAFEAPGPWSYDQIAEWPDGTHRELHMAAEGSNFGATSQPGEPVHAGAGAGASVWYRWTPTESGPAGLLFHSNGQPHAVVAIYSGNSLAGLTPVASRVEPTALLIQFPAEAGREYRIAVDGLAAADGAPWMGNFFLNLIEQLPDRSSGSTARPTAPAPLPAPKLVRRKINAKARIATFRFRSGTPGAAFRCRLDKHPFKRCHSPYRVHGLAVGKHRLAVRVTAPGRAASAPAIVHFALPVSPPRR